MLRTVITDHIWSKLAPLLKEFKIHFSLKVRKFIEAVFWKLRTGAPWRDLPTEYGSHSTVFNKFNRWSKSGIWRQLFLKIRVDIDFEWNFIDSTIVRAHQHASGFSKKSRECIGKSAGGNSTKIHMLSDSHGNPIDFVLSEGQTHDSKLCPDLIKMSQAENIIADKAYNSEDIRDKIRRINAQPIIPKKSNSINKTNDGFDKELYKLRHLIENLFARLKHFRGFATRFEKAAKNFKSMIYIACTFIWSKI